MFGNYKQKLTIKSMRFFSDAAKKGVIIKFGKQQDLNTIIKESKSPVMLDFYADWCGPCKNLTPSLEKLTEAKDFTLVKINIDEHDDLAEQYGVQSIPHVILLKDGKKTSSFIGNNKVELENMSKLL